jgi:glucosamine 6-phosphate synthetase-like amidotransferase/phosphosugar isomerase protein
VKLNQIAQSGQFNFLKQHAEQTPVIFIILDDPVRQ